MKTAIVTALTSEPWGDVLQDPAMSFVLFGIVFVYSVMALMWPGLRQQ